MQINFTKMQGSGNDFIMIDNREGIVPDQQKKTLVTTTCPRALAVGADGVIFLENDEEFDFRWDFYNADGSEAEMCGNGARCMAVFAHTLGAAGTTMTFRTIAGPISAEIIEGGAKIKLTDADVPEFIPELPVDGRPTDVYFINTGVPHAVVAVDDIEHIDIKKFGSSIRYHDRFAPAGTNANFMMKDGNNRIALRTYERGVEDETLACGTGSVACAVVATQAFSMNSPVSVCTRSGVMLDIDFNLDAEKVTEVYLSGPAETVYQATIELDI